MSNRATRMIGNPVDSVMKARLLASTAERELSLVGEAAPSEKLTELKGTLSIDNQVDGIIIYHRDGSPCLIPGSIIKDLGACYHDLVEMTDYRDVLARLEGLAVGKLDLDLEPMNIGNGQRAYALRARELGRSGLVGNPFYHPSEQEIPGRWFNLGISLSSKGGFPGPRKVQTAAIYGSTRPTENYGKQRINSGSSKKIRRDPTSI